MQIHFTYIALDNISCGKEQYVEVDQPYDMEELCNQVMKGMLLRFLQVDIHIPDELIDKFSKFCPCFVVDSIPDDSIPRNMHKYQMSRTGRKTIHGTKKLLGVTCANKILLHKPKLKWYLEHGLKVIAIHKYLKYKSGQPFSWFPKEVSKARRDGDSDLALKQLGDTHKLKGNLSYGNMIEDLMNHLKTTFTINEELFDESFRSPFFENLEEINTTFEIKEHKWQVTISRPYQCGIAIYQLAKLINNTFVQHI